MKFHVILLCVIVSSYSAPSKKLFHEHLEDFVGVILAEKGRELEVLLKQYAENKEFCMSLTFLRTSNFRDMVYKIESLPEFKAVTKFLEQNNINILYMIEADKEIIDQYEKAQKLPHKLDGNQLNSFMRDFVSHLPREKLASLLEEKKQEDEVFRTAVDNFDTKKWNKLYSDLWENDIFQKEVRELAENGIELSSILQQFGNAFEKKARIIWQSTVGVENEGRETSKRKTAYTLVGITISADDFKRTAGVKWIGMAQDSEKINEDNTITVENGYEKQVVLIFFLAHWKEFKHC